MTAGRVKPDDPHPARDETPPPSNAARANKASRVRMATRRRFQRRRGSRAANVTVGGIHGAGAWFRACCATVVMVTVLLAGLLPGVSVGGAKVAVAPGGSPLALKLMTPLNAPPLGVTVSVYCTGLPPVTVCAVEVVVTVKSEVTAASPVPVRVVVCVGVAELSVTVMEAL